MKKIKILMIFLGLSLSTTISFSQTVSCSQISELINFEPILKNFRIAESSESFILIDKEKIFSQDCTTFNWGKNKLQIIQDTALERVSVRGGSANHFNGQSQYFFIDSFNEKGNAYKFTIVHASSNEFVDCKVVKKRNRYKLVWFSGGVY